MFGEWGRLENSTSTVQSKFSFCVLSIKLRHHRLRWENVLSLYQSCIKSGMLRALIFQLYNLLTEALLLLLIKGPIVPSLHKTLQDRILNFHLNYPRGELDFTCFFKSPYLP